MGVLVTALLVLSQSSPAVSADLSDWQWDLETPICTLRQEIPSGGRIELRRTPANDETELSITIRTGPKLREGKYHDAALTSFPGARAVGDISVSRDDEGQLQVHAVTPDPMFIESISSASALEVVHQKIAPIRIAIKSPSSAVSALRDCEDRKMRAWGLDPISWRALRSGPFPLDPVRDRFSHLDYPTEALAQGIEFDAITRLDVASNGRVEQCKTLNPGAYRGFEDAACGALKGARFKPALDASGKPVSAPVIYDIRFCIDKDSPAP